MAFSLEHLIAEHNERVQAEQDSIEHISRDQEIDYLDLFARGARAFDAVINGQTPNQHIVFGEDPDYLFFPGVSMGYHRVQYGRALKRKLVVAQAIKRIKELESRPIVSRQLDLVVPRSGRHIDPRDNFYNYSNSHSIGFVELQDPMVDTDLHTLEEYEKTRAFALIAEEVVARVSQSS